MAQDNFEALLQAAFLQRFPPHVILIRQGDPADFLHVVMDGLLELFAVHEQREFGLFLMGRDGVFPLGCVIEDVPSLFSVRVLESAQVFMVPAGAVRLAFGRDAVFAQSIALTLARNSRDVTKELANQKMRPSSERLANWLLREVGKEGGPGAASRISLRIDKRTLASLIGTTPENLSRNFSILSAHGVVVRGREIVVEKPEALRAFAAPHPLVDVTEA
jgi:CRP/FNR family transcriptional regulator, transcriptional activator FtrB